MSAKRRLTRRIGIIRNDWWDPSYLSFSTNTKLHSTMRSTARNLDDPSPKIAELIDTISKIDNVAQVVRVGTYDLVVAFESRDTVHLMMAKVVEAICRHQDWNINDTTIGWCHHDFSDEIRNLLK
jgi:hypothetical protein